MTEEMLGLGDSVVRRLQQAFADEEPATGQTTGRARPGAAPRPHK
jgi:hypothetical protein